MQFSARNQLKGQVKSIRSNDISAACTTVVQEVMKIFTEDNEVVDARKTILELILANHSNDCMTCERTGNCRLQDYCYIYGIKSSSFSGEKKEFPIDSVNHLIERDHNKCILCGLYYAKIHACSGWNQQC